MKVIQRITWLYIPALLVFLVVVIVLYLTNEQLFPNILLIPNKPIVDYIISFTGFF